MKSNIRVHEETTRAKLWPKTNTISPAEPRKRRAYWTKVIKILVEILLLCQLSPSRKPSSFATLALLTKAELGYLQKSTSENGSFGHTRKSTSSWTSKLKLPKEIASCFSDRRLNHGLQHIVVFSK